MIPNWSRCMNGTGQHRRTRMLKDRIRKTLLDQAQIPNLLTYRELAEALALAPPHTVRRVTQALEALMAEDAAAGRPFLAALCVSQSRPGMPGRGFFEAAWALGVFPGDPDGPEAGAFHTRELQRALTFYRGQGKQHLETGGAGGYHASSAPRER